MALRPCRRFVRAGTLKMIPIANSKRDGDWRSNAGPRFRGSAGAHDLDVLGLQYRPSLSLAGGRAAGFGGHSTAATAPPARPGHGSSGDLCRRMLWRLRAGRSAPSAGDGSPRKSPACFEDDLVLRCPSLILISKCLQNV